MKIMIRLLLVLSLVSSLAVPPSAYAGPKRGSAKNAKVAQLAKKNASEKGAAIHVQMSNDKGEVADTRTAWATMSESDFNEHQWAEKFSPEGTKENPLVIFTIESKRAIAERIQRAFEARGVFTKIVVIQEDVYQNWAKQDGQAIGLGGGFQGAAAVVGIHDGPSAKDNEILRWKDFNIPATDTEIAVGTALTTFSFGFGAIAWITAGINPFAAATLITLQTTMSALYNIKTEAWTRVMITPIKEGKRISHVAEFGRRMGWDLLQSELWRTLSGPLASAHSVTTGLGQVEIATNLLAGSGGGALYVSMRDQALDTPETQFARKWGNFLVSFPTLVFSRLDAMGHTFYNFHSFGPFDLTLSKVLLFGTFVASGMLIKRYPDKFVKFAEKPERLMNKAIDQFYKLTGKSRCAEGLEDL